MRLVILIVINFKMENVSNVQTAFTSMKIKIVSKYQTSVEISEFRKENAINVTVDMN